ncbi:lipoprotein [Mycoplasma mycoides subsp. capri]|uniref:MAG6410 family transglutaminase-related lipoprotein n=1 Tax=Mycoplasma mycoides TaxID=2102 RepID=UPI00223F7B94|nr:transglutaminase domain-containing protein [Mycoplasma mycoides]QVJ96721.1 lipoprotein [Mycoplasma mycoides subsp. capri]QVJ97614.1 lipoprotein [Mycoplasma mycoides subsp. capri]QVK00606.1 lipoprotein [Mycoplasma mycoides subsp. capri]QVK01494.1 lipoprotein [Mycoplasma mycoides subsp. capri]
MKKLLKLLSLSSIINLTTTTISCSVNNSNTKNNLVIPTIPTTNKKPNKPNNNLSPNSESDRNQNNNLAPNNEDFKPSNNDSNQGSNHNNSDNIDDNNNSSNDDIIDRIDNDTNNGHTYFSSISRLNHNLTELENKYIDFENKNFQPINTNENQIKEIILNSKLPNNFYSHPKYKLEKTHIILDEFENKEVKLKLIDVDSKSEISNDDIKWYQKISYPQNKVLDTKESQENGTFILSDEGTVKWKDTKSTNEEFGPEEKSARLWASYKGYLYSAIVIVYSSQKSKTLNNENEAKKMAKEIVEKNGWKNLPTLEKLTKAYEWMTKEVKYDYDFTTGPILKNQNAHSALVKRYTVCTGYAKGLKLLLEELGIPCRFIEGHSERESRLSKHAWNLVQLDNEWYHVDATSDRVENKQTKTDFKFFLNTNRDFAEYDNFVRDFSNPGSSLRNLKLKNFVETEDDVIALIDNNWDPNKKQINKLNLITNGKNFITVSNAFDKRGLVVKNNGSKINAIIGPNKDVSYTFNNQSSEQITDVKVTKIQKDDKKNAIQIDFDKNVPDLRIGNFNIKNALIKKIEKSGNSYILYLNHFSSFGKVKVELESIKRKDYKFDLNKNDSVEFNIEKQEKPNISIQALDNKNIKINSQLPNLEYNFNNTSWQEVPKDFIIKNATIGSLYVRYKETATKPSSDIQVIEISKSNEIDNLVKLVNNNMLIGLDYSMEYKKEEDSNWTSIKKTALKDLKSGTYWVRVKASGSALASDISKVEIK